MSLFLSSEAVVEVLAFFILAGIFAILTLSPSVVATTSINAPDGEVKCPDRFIDQPCSADSKGEDLDSTTAMTKALNECTAAFKACQTVQDTEAELNRQTCEKVKGCKLTYENDITTPPCTPNWASCSDPVPSGTNYKCEADGHYNRKNYKEI